MHKYTIHTGMFVGDRPTRQDSQKSINTNNNNNNNRPAFLFLAFFFRVKCRECYLSRGGS
jgi:hypothetical protein